MLNRKEGFSLLASRTWVEDPMAWLWPGNQNHRHVHYENFIENSIFDEPNRVKTPDLGRFDRFHLRGRWRKRRGEDAPVGDGGAYRSICKTDPRYPGLIAERKGPRMIVNPWFSKGTGEGTGKTAVYHHNLACPAGKKIGKTQIRSGTDDRPLCRHCSRLGAKAASIDSFIC